MSLRTRPSGAPAGARLLALALGGLAAPSAAAAAPPEVHRLEVRYASSHGCSQSHASTSFRGAVTLTLDGGRATLTLAGRHHYAIGPSLGRFRQSGGKAQTSHTESVVDLTLRGTARRAGARVVVTLDRAEARCKTTSGYLHTTQFACRVATPVTLRCAPAVVAVHPAGGAGAGAYPGPGERTTPVPVLRCEVAARDLGLLGDLRFQDALPLHPRGLVHHLQRMTFGSPQSILRHLAAPVASR